MQPSGERSFTPVASGDARQLNLAGDNYGPIYVQDRWRTPAVHQLPSAPSDFIDRGDLDAELRRALPGGYGSPRIVNLHGLPGVGKSALGLHIAHAVSSQDYPDCQLYFDLREYGQPDPVYDLLGAALVALGVPVAEVPSGRAARAATYRSALDRLRTLVFVDNATGAADVQPLIPGYGTAAVIITSWSPITDLPGVRTVSVPVLTEDKAIQMLGAVSGRAIAPGDLAAVREVIRSAGQLPLALRIAAGSFKARPHWSWADVQRRLTAPDGSTRLDRFRTGNLALEKTFALAYDDLGGEVALAYRCLGLSPTARISGALARVLAAPDPGVAEDLVDELISREFLQHESATTFRMHGLLWQAARSLSMPDDPAQQQARERMTRWALDQLDGEYLPRLCRALNDVQGVRGPVRDLAMEQIFIDSPVAGPDGGEESLTTLFPGTPHVVLTAGGGSGKTILAGHLCRSAASERLTRRVGPIPLIALIRDIPGSDYHDVPTLLLRTLRHRYGLDMTADAVAVALSGGHVFVVLDGLDELADPELRQSVVTSIHEFAAGFPDVPLLVTSRPYLGLESDWPGYLQVQIRPWSHDVAMTYVQRLAHLAGAGWAASRVADIIGRHVRDQAILTSPLALQMVVDGYDRRRMVPETYADLVELYLWKGIVKRERLRGTLEVPEFLVREILEATAFALQSNTANRISIGENELTRIAIAVVTDSEGGHRQMDALRILQQVIERVGLMQQMQRGAFSFTHTVFREYLAAAYLSRRTPEEAAAAVRAHSSDASWGEVMRTALTIARPDRPGFAREIADRLGDRPDLAESVVGWERETRT